MEYITCILMAFVLINAVLKLSFWQPWQAALFGLLCGAFIIVTCRYSILQSKTQLADLLRNARVMQDAAVVVTVESAICFSFCFTMLTTLFGRAKRTLWLRTLLRWYPGLLLFPALFYVQTQLIFAMPGTDFTALSCVLASAFVIILPTAVCLVRLLYPEEELRLEVHFLVSLFVGITGLITTVDANVTYAAVNAPTHVGAILAAVVLFALLFLAGWIGSRLKWMIRRKKTRNN